MKITLKQIDAVLALSPKNRYEHFVKVVADWQEVWGLFHDQWALASADSGETVFPVWPAKEYSSLCAKNNWANFVTKSFSLDELLNELLPNFKRSGVLLRVFDTPSDQGITLSIDQFINDLNIELEKY